jgi:membrane fusion protein, multidrug efflux system
MKRSIRTLSLIFSATILIASCGGGAKDKKGGVGDLRVELEKKKKEKTTIETEIRKLEEDIAKADPSAAQSIKKLVAVDTLNVRDFSHFIELQGKIDAEGMAYVSPSGQGGQVKAIYVKVGQRVGKGQRILKLDDAVARQQVAAAQQQIGVLKTQLALAQTTYERYQNLWKQNIGSEMNVIRAKAEVDNWQGQLNAAYANVRVAQEMANMSNVYAQISGVVDMVNVKVGEFFGPTPNNAARPETGIRIVNNSNMKIVTNVPENYITRIKNGARVEVTVPESGRAPYKTVISVIGGSIDPTNRSFTVEAKLPSDPVLKPNQVATMRILDYERKAAVAVPVNVVQTDETGKYIYVVESTGGKLVARKKRVEVGEAYGGVIEIKIGLTGNEVIITEGYQTVYDGQAITTGK